MDDNELEVSLLKTSYRRRTTSFKDSVKKEAHFFVGWLKETPSCFCWKFPKIVPRWACLSGFLLIFFVFLMLLFFVAFPLILKSLANDMKVEFVDIMMYNPRSDRFAMNGTAKFTNSPLTSTIGAMKLRIEFDGDYLGYIHTPQIHLKRNTATTVFMQTDFVMENVDLIESFISELVNSTKPTTWTLKGKADVYLSGIVFPKISIEKQIQLVGFSGLSNSSILDFGFPSDGPDHTIDAFVNASLNNPSIFGFDFGNVTVGAYYKDKFLGACTAINPVTLPGNNTVYFSGYMKPEDMEAASEAASKYAAGESVDIIVKGTEIGDPSIKWIQIMARSLQVPVTIHGPTNLTLIHSIVVDLLNLSFISNDQLQAGANITATFELPPEFRFPFEIFNISLDINGFYHDTEFITVSVPWSYAESNSTSDTLSTGFEQAPFQVLNEDVFVEFIKAAVGSPLVNATVKGLGKGMVRTNVGVLTLENIKAETSISLQGLNNFSTLPVEILDLNILSATPDIVEIEGTILVTNPLYLEAFVSVLPLTVFLNGTECGNVTARPFEINAKSASFVSAVGYLDQSNPVAKKNIEEFLSSYADGRNSSVQVQGLKEAEPIDILKNAIGNITADFEIPPLQHGLIYYVEAYLDPYYNVQGEIPAKLFVTNPWDVNLFVTGVKDGKVLLTKTQEQVISLNVDLSDAPILVKPSSRGATSKLIGKIVGLSVEEIEALVGPIRIDLIAVLEASIGGETVEAGFQTSFRYTQYNVSASFWPPDRFPVP